MAKQSENISTGDSESIELKENQMVIEKEEKSEKSEVIYMEVNRQEVFDMGEIDIGNYKNEKTPEFPLVFEDGEPKTVKNLLNLSVKPREKQNGNDTWKWGNIPEEKKKNVKFTKKGLEKEKRKGVIGDRTMNLLYQKYKNRNFILEKKEGTIREKNEDDLTIRFIQPVETPNVKEF